MKRNLIVFVVALSLINTEVKAQFVVSLHSSGSVQNFVGVNAFINAYTNASNGDTIYLPGGSFVPPVSIDKGIKVFGAGHYPDSTAVTGKTFINGNLLFQDNADNFQMEGIEVLGNVDFAENIAVNQIVIKYCKISGAFNVPGNSLNPSSNLMFINSVFIGDVTFSNAVNCAMYNCFFQSHIVNSVGNLFYNNVLLYAASFNSPVLYSQFVNNILCNNIFFQINWDNITHGSGNTYKNNVFLMASPNLGTAPIAVNNYFGVSSSVIFQSQSGNAFNYSHNYHLQSPATYIGTDSTEIGVYGGYYPYKEGAVPSNPHISLKTISPATDAQGKLNVLIKVAAQDK